MIKHDSQFNPKISKDQYLLELKNADSELDVFRLKGIRKNIESIKRLVNQKKYKRNFERIRDSFLLFEDLLNYSKEVDLSQFGTLYNLGFSGNWDSTLYFVGFKICEQIELVNGRYSIKEYIDKAPTQLLVDNITLYKKDKNIRYKFSPNTEQIMKMKLHNDLIKN